MERLQPQPERDFSAQEESPEFHVDPDNYRLLDPEDLQKYLEYTDGLIGILDGSIPAARRRGEIVYEAIPHSSFAGAGAPELHRSQVETTELGRPDTVIYLDKSARPSEWLVRSLWETLATANDGEVPRRPETRFLNIDRYPWLRKMGVPQREIESIGPSGFDLEKIAPTPEAVREELAKIRLLFVKDSRREQLPDGTEREIKLTEDNWVKEVWKMPLRGNLGKAEKPHLMIVDEMRSSGATLDIAQRLLAAALPETRVSGTHWCVPAKKSLGMVEGELQKTENWAPVWYNKHREGGRGIGNVDVKWYLARNSEGEFVHPWKAREAAFVLSRPLLDTSGERADDVLTDKLRADVKQLSEDVRERNVMIIPSTKRETQQRVDQIERVSGISIDQWREERGISPQR